MNFELSKCLLGCKCLIVAKFLLESKRHRIQPLNRQTQTLHCSKSTKLCARLTHTQNKSTMTDFLPFQIKDLELLIEIKRNLANSFISFCSQPLFTVNHINICDYLIKETNVMHATEYLTFCTMKSADIQIFLNVAISQQNSLLLHTSLTPLSTLQF